jgi:hypothetical protein
LSIRCALSPKHGGETLTATHPKLNRHYPRADTQPSATHTSGASRNAGQTILKFRKIILRIGETTNRSRLN